MLQLINVKKDYDTAGQSVHALKGVDLCFRKNEFVSILGASGCGKTTMLNIIGGLDHYTSGDLVINGKSTKDYKDHDWDVYRNHRIGFVFQSYNLIPHQTVLGNVEIALTIAGTSKMERRERAIEALKRVGLQEELHKRPNQLSGGQMQRVAIARALVNNPEILLADEPTGALDTVTSVQIMDLIREIAGERLVIMVTHNPELAEEYSSRIVRLQDGLVVSDSNPCSVEELLAEQEGREWINPLPPPISKAKKEPKKEVEKERQQASKGAHTILKKQFEGAREAFECPICQQSIKIHTNESIMFCPNCNAFLHLEWKKKISRKEEEPKSVVEPTKKEKKVRKVKTKTASKRQKKERSSMSFKTSLGLSARNLATKKGRTIITSVAGSIGIISVCLVLALSNGFNNYILKTEEDMLSYYPVTISERSMDVNAVMEGMSGMSDMPDLDKLGDKVYVNSILSNIAGGMMVTNDISEEYQNYLNGMDEDLYEVIQYSYGVNLMNSLYTSTTMPMPDGAGGYVSQPITISLASLKDSYVKMLAQDEELEQYASLAGMVDMLGSIVSTMPGTTDFKDEEFGRYVRSQYDVMGEFPSNANEAVLVVGQNNDVTDITLTQLGLWEIQKVIDNLSKGESTKQEEYEIAFSTILEKEYRLCGNDEIYYPSEDGKTFYYNGAYVAGADGKQLGTPIKITAILRLKEGYSYGCLSNGLNITEALVQEHITKNQSSQLATWLQQQLASGDKTAFDKDGAAYNLMQMHDASTTKELQRAVGAIRSVSGVSLYTSNFETKQGMLSYLDAWNDKNSSADKVQFQIKYDDTVGMMMSLMQTMLDAITYILVAFTSISLVVSSVMIGIITYVSVVERVKEIGVLRSLGARKKDIKNLFNAETFIIGLSAGLIGVGVTYLLSLGINAIFKSLAGIAGIATLPISSAAIMVAISIGLTLISGLIPASAAAKKDPVVALRTE